MKDRLRMLGVAILAIPFVLYLCIVAVMVAIVEGRKYEPKTRVLKEGASGDGRNDLSDTDDLRSSTDEVG